MLRAEDVLARAARLAPNEGIMLHPLVGGLDAETSWELLRNFFGKVAPHIAMDPL